MAVVHPANEGVQMKRSMAKLLPGTSYARSLTAAAVAALAIQGCSADPPDTSVETQAADTTDGTTSPLSQLPVIDSTANTKVLGEALAKPTALGETTAIHVRLPPPQNAQLSESLVRIVGPDDNPQLLFRTDALVKLGVVSKSPGKDFFTTFATLSPDQLSALAKNQDQISGGAFGKPTSQSVVFDGRSPAGLVANPRIDPTVFKPGNGPVPINQCALRPMSTQAAWDEALFIRDPAVVQDPTRTWDPCTGAGTQGGVWTFAHLIREMANGSGKTPEDFTLDWLSLWLNDYTVNSDLVGARSAMFGQVIQPWATASGVTATMITDASGHSSLTMSGPLNLDIAPYRLLAIVNRIDLGGTANGPAGYSGTVTSRPTSPGELRFVFGVVQPNPWGAGSEATCGKKRFTTIFEYGVPGTGCTASVKWAQQWTSLLSLGGFTPAYLSQLQSMTESVVLHGSAPAKGNGNAIDQIRTNEIALAGPWELREFTLSTENFAANTDTPSNGELRAHTVALSPNDGAFNAAGPDATINSFVASTVLPGVILPVSNPNQCNAAFTMPFSFGGTPFRGGNVQIGPGHWNVSTVTTASPPASICARHQFSLNTCGGCHHDDSGTNGTGGSTNFTHVDPLSTIPVTLSKFLTGGGPGLTFNVNDPQLTTPAWPFADLQRRFERLFDISHCTSCLVVASINPNILKQLAQLGPVPIDPGPVNPFPFKVGPVTDMSVVQQLLDARAKFAGSKLDQPADFIRAITTQSD
jgi:hypothetical protein